MANATIFRQALKLPVPEEIERRFFSWGGDAMVVKLRESAINNFV